MVSLCLLLNSGYCVNRQNYPEYRKMEKQESCSDLVMFALAYADLFRILLPRVSFRFHRSISHALLRLYPKK